MNSHFFPEIYVKDVKTTLEIFQRLFNVRVGEQYEDFAQIFLGDTRLIIQQLKLDEFEERNPVRKSGALEHLGAGLELGVMVENLDDTYTKAQAENFEYLSPIKLQEWGMRDFRFLLLDGYYIRVTSEG